MGWKSWLSSSYLHESVRSRVSAVARLEDVELLLAEDGPGPGGLADGALGLAVGVGGVAQDAVPVMAGQGLPVR